MEQQIILHRPWTCQWGRFGQVVAPGREATPAVFWSCTHPALPDGAQLLASGECTECPRWAPCSRLMAEQRDRQEGAGAEADETGGGEATHEVRFSSLV
jgi:hypothetical protein